MQRPPFLLYIVDDDEDDLFIINNAFKQIGLENVCKGFLSGQELLSHLKYNPDELPDVIILDYDMPKMNGSQVLDQLSAITRLRNIPVIIYSDKLRPSLEAELRSRGANCCIKKGISSGEQQQFAESILEYLKK